jgi:phenylalanyl-tRNA synthetase alpha chain
MARFPRRFDYFDDFHPVASLESNFDSILIPKNHVTRRLFSPGKRSDSFYVDKDTVLRTQTSAHQVQTLGRGHHSSIILGEVFRKDQIDATHYPVFHQMEAFTLYKVSDLLEYAEELLSANQLPDIVAQAPDVQNKDYRYFDSQSESARHGLVRRLVINDLKETHINLFKFILRNGDFTSRWNPDFFPFTEPSYELEIYLKDRWMEVLGSGVIHKDVLRNANIDPEQYIGWASGVGLERICMILFDIPDIRLFWSQDPRFLNQFEKGKVSKFKPFSKYPSCFKDISFYVADPHAAARKRRVRGERTLRSASLQGW